MKHAGETHDGDFWMKLRRAGVRSVAIFALALALPTASTAQMAMPSRPVTPPKTEKKKERDPIYNKSQPIAKFDAETEAALKRGKEAGTLMAEVPKPDRIYIIRVLGAKKVEPDAVLLQLKTHINDHLNKRDIQEDIRRIYAMGLFKDVVVDSEPGPQDSLIITYQLTEKPTIFKVKISGNDAISEEDIREAIDLRPYHVADVSRIRENLEKIRKLYADKGYFLAGITYEITPTTEEEMSKGEPTPFKGDGSKATIKINKPKVYAPDFVDVVYNIKEESKVRIERISFVGNENLSGDLIKTNMRSKENHPLGMVTQWGTYNEEMFDVDMLLIEQLYQDHGYLNIHVGKPRVGLSADKNRLSIQIPLTEGKRYNIGVLDVGGDFVVDDEEAYDERKAQDLDEPTFLHDDLRKRISLQDGDTFNRTRLMQDIMGVQELYKDEGYAYVNITPETQIHDENQTVDVKLQVDSGPKVTIERIDIKGNTTTADEVIRRELRVYEGELYSSSLMRLSEMRVNQLGYFETAKFTTKPGSEPDKMVVEIEVKEKRTGSLQVGGGYGTGGEGWLFQGQITQNNLFGRGQSLTGTVQWSGFRRIFDIRFVDPYLTYLGDEPLTMSFSAYNTQRLLGDYSRGSTGGDVTVGYPIGKFLKGFSRQWLKDAPVAAEPYVPDFENLRLYLSYNVERVEISDNSLGVKYFGLHALEPRYTTSLRPILQLDQRNNRLFPSAGYFLELRSEFANSYFGSILLADWERSLTAYALKDGIAGGLSYLKAGAQSNNFIRAGANARAYYNFDSWFFLKGWVLKLNIDMGLINTFGVPIIAENYRLGGIGIGNVSGLRGYYFQSIGPVQGVSREFHSLPEYQFVIGGNKQFVANLELEFPIVKSINFSGVLFFDMGNVFGPNENYFYIGGDPNKGIHQHYDDPLGTFRNLGLFSSAGFGVRWFSPFGPLRFEWGFPIVKRPPGTPGMPLGDNTVQFEFNIGQSF